jgi:ABC-type bacteriocin/lantibiotic exporter with double-glycine peptidase domain
MNYSFERITMHTYIHRLKQALRSGFLAEIFREIKWIIPYIRRYRNAILYYILLGILGTVASLAGSIASKYLIDSVTGFDSLNIWFIITIILSMAIGNIIVGAASSRISAKINMKVNNEMLAEIYEKIMKTDWEAISEYHSGDLLNRLNTDVGVVAGSVLGFVPSLITGLLQFIGILAIIIYYDPTMAVIALISAPISLLLSKVLMVRMREYNQKMMKISSEMMAFGEESFQNLQVIKCFDLISHFRNKLKGIQDNYITMALDYNKFSILTSSFLSVIGLLVSYATFGWGVYRLWSGLITYGTMTLFLQLSTGLSGSFSSLVGLVPTVISAATSAGRIMAITELPRENEEEGIKEQVLRMKAENAKLTISISHLDFTYQGREAVLKDVNVAIGPRELVAIVGPSGEGKTTLLRILLGLLRPTAGEVACSLEDGTKTEVSALTRRLFSYVPQDYTIFSGTIADNLRMGKPEATDEELIEALKAACAYEIVNELPEGINSPVGEMGGVLSEGQLQRLSIARAILRDSPILVLDEATSALDPVTERKVLQGIMTYGQKHSCIMTTHRQSVIDICNRVYRIMESRISEVKEKQPLEIIVND